MEDAYFRLLRLLEARSGLSQRDLARKMAEYETLKGEIEQLQREVGELRERRSE